MRSDSFGFRFFPPAVALLEASTPFLKPSSNPTLWIPEVLPASLHCEMGLADPKDIHTLIEYIQFHANHLRESLPKT
jgi:hypothetical protein